MINREARVIFLVHGTTTLRPEIEFHYKFKLVDKTRHIFQYFEN
jgi:hypothetical protein